MYSLKESSKLGISMLKSKTNWNTRAKIQICSWKVVARSLHRPRLQYLSRRIASSQTFLPFVPKIHEQGSSRIYGSKALSWELKDAWSFWNKRFLSSPYLRDIWSTLPQSILLQSNNLKKYHLLCCLWHSHFSHFGSIPINYSECFYYF